MPRAFHALDHGVMDKIQNWIKTRGAFSIFAMSAIFNPLFFPFTAIAGMMHFGWWRFFLLCLAGKVLKNIIVAGAGYFGVQVLLDIIRRKIAFMTDAAAPELVYYAATGNIFGLVRGRPFLHRPLQGAWLKLCTIGGLGVWWLLDIILIAAEYRKDRWYRPLVHSWNPR